jgi:hypothetical protein
VTVRYLPDRLHSEIASSPAGVVPSLDADGQRGVGSLLHLCAAVLSWMIGERAAKSCGDVYQLQAALLLYGQSADAEPAQRPSTRTPTILRERGLSRGAVRLLWRGCRAEYGYLAALDMDLLAAVYPPAVWRALAGLIADGPGVCSQRIDRVLHLVALRPAAAHAGGGDGALVSRKTLQNYAWPLSWTMRTLVDLHQHGFPCEALAGWMSRPVVRVPPAPLANTDRSAPPRRLIRLLWQQLDSEIKQRLGAHSDEDELDVVRSCSVHRLRGGGIWGRMRLRALFALTCCLGGRSGAVCELRRRHLLADHVAPDGSCGPAIALRPGKTYAAQEIHYKPIPGPLRDVIEVFAIATDRILTETPDYTAAGRITRPPAPDDLALFPKSLREPGRALSQPGFYVQLTGYAARPQAGRGERAPLLPRRDGRGFSPHTLRGAAMQMIKHAALSHPPEQHPGLDGDDLIEALVDHEVPGDRHGYLDKNTLRGRELLSAIATTLAWDTLTTEAGARRVRDGTRYRTYLGRHSVLQSELDRLQREISQLLSEPPQRSEQAARILFELRGLDEERDQVKTRLHAVEQQLERLRHDAATRIATPDDIPDDELTDQFGQIDRELHARPGQAATESLPAPVRAQPWVTISEAAEILEISYPQMARWANGQHLPYAAGDPRNPWQPDRAPVDRSLGPRRRRIAVAHINPAFLRTATQQHRLAHILATWPAGWTNRQCMATLTLPDAWRHGA